MATPTPTAVIRLSGLAQRLVDRGLLSEAQASQAYEQALQAHTPFVTFLVQKKLVGSRDGAIAASEEFGVPLLDLDAVDLGCVPLDVIDLKIVQRRHALPLMKRGNRLFVAVSDAANTLGLDEIKFQTGISVDAILVEDDKLTKAIERVAESQNKQLAGLAEADLENLQLESGEQGVGPDVTAAEVEDAPIVRFVNKVLLDGITRGASDVHFEPYEKVYRVRYRIDGELYEIAVPPVNLAGRLAARLKVMSRLDISERRVPQDGRIKLRISKSRAIDFRVNTCPTLFGEKVVLRILDSAAAQIGVEALGFEADQKRLFLDTIKRPQGMVLVTGPTGSGKTVTLYTALHILNTPEVNISTAEDPVEIYLSGVNQVNVYPKVGLTFAEALRAFLRQDPDIIMVGEIRDLETADIAIKASQTGHMVLSTVHTNDAPNTLTRLMNIGVAPYNIASSVSLIIAQRLARRLCPYCKKPVEIPRTELLREGFKEQELESLVLFAPVGCEQCTNGFKGRVGIYQVLPVTEDIGRLIMEGGNAIQIADLARKESVANLREAGLRKVRAGITSLDELNAVIAE